MNTIERIQYYEEIFDEALEKVANLEKALDEYETLIPKINELKAYYLSEAWRRDYRDDANGLVPQNMKRGILSEDGIFNLMTDEFEQINRMKTIADSNDLKVD